MHAKVARDCPGRQPGLHWRIPRVRATRCWTDSIWTPEGSSTLRRFTTLTTVLVPVETQAWQLLRIPADYRIAAHLAVGWPHGTLPARLSPCSVENFATCDYFDTTPLHPSTSRASIGGFTEPLQHLAGVGNGAQNPDCACARLQRGGAGPMKACPIRLARLGRPGDLLCWTWKMGVRRAVVLRAFGRAAR